MATSKRIKIKDEKVCRTCLSKENVLHSLFSVEVGKDSLDCIVVEVTGLKIHRNDGLPTTICSICKEKAEKAYEFKKQSYRADASWTEHLKIRKNDNLDINHPLEVNNRGVKTENVSPDRDDCMDGNSETELSFGTDKQAHGEFDEICKTSESPIPHHRGSSGDKDFCCQIFNYTLNPVKDDLEKLTLLSRTFCKEHLVKPESPTTPPCVECEHCLLVFETRNELEDHQRNHCIEAQHEEVNPTFCPMCGKRYEGPANLSKHMWKYHAEIMVSKKRGRPKKLINDAILTRLSENGFLISSVGTSYGCTFCHKVIENKTEFTAHQQAHKDHKVYCCKLCKKKYLKKKNYAQHKCIEDKTSSKLHIEGTSKTHKNVAKVTANVLLVKDLLDSDGDTVELPDVCRGCSRLFFDEGDLTKHLDTEHPELSLKCNVCTKEFSSLKSAARHRLLCQEVERKHKCPSCGLRFAYQISLNKHILRYHEGQSVSVKFIDPLARLSEKQFQCDTCKKRFYKKELLARHAKIHSPNEKYHECDVCKKTFRRSDNLRSHKRIHDSDRPKSIVKNCLCSFCGRSFSNSSNLIVHMRRHTGEKPYKCDFCDKGFPRSSDLQCHRRSHTGEKPCICSICRKGFSRSNKLSRHMRVHTGQRPYKCTYCEKAFSQSNDLTLHIRRHTGDRPYICEVCGDRFIQGTALQNHRRAHGHFSNPAEQMQMVPYTGPSTFTAPSTYTAPSAVHQ